MTRLNEIKALGVRLAVDDFGTGYSSLSYLRRFPIDILKIDKVFVDGVAQDSEASALANAIVELGRALDLQVAAEGIELSGQLDQLRDMGCDLGQGFYWARPLPTEAAGALLAARAQDVDPDKSATDAAA
jgi:EAL domain-containing protein (putative c-di-GMP-specific phosphodiesterase class I)